MKRIDKGIINKVSDNSIEVKLDGEGDCVNCPLVSHCKMNEIITINTEKARNYMIGQEIEVIVHTSKKMLLQTYIFIVPVFALIIGVILGKIIFGSEESSVLSGAFLFILSMVMFILLSKRTNIILYKIKE